MRTNARIYVMRADDGTLKLGHSKDPERRRKEIRRAVEIVHITDVIQHVERIERLAHRVLALHGKHLRGEFASCWLTLFCNHKPRVIGGRVWLPSSLLPDETLLRQIVIWARPVGRARSFTGASWMPGTSTRHAVKLRPRCANRR